MLSIILSAIIGINTAIADVNIHTKDRRHIHNNRNINRHHIHDNRNIKPTHAVSHNWVWNPGYWKYTSFRSYWIRGHWDLKLTSSNINKKKCKLHK